MAIIEWPGGVIVPCVCGPLGVLPIRLRCGIACNLGIGNRVQQALAQRGMSIPTAGGYRYTS